MSAFLTNESVADNGLKEEFLTGDEDYRYAYAEDFLNTYIATQIKVLRDERGMKQEDLAEAIGTKQSGISRLENVNYSNWKTETLRKIARALGVRLRISFETFGSLLGEDANFSKDSLKRPKFEDDPRFKKRDVRAIRNTERVIRASRAWSRPVTLEQLSLAFDETRPYQALSSQVTAIGDAHVSDMVSNVYPLRARRPARQRRKPRRLGTVPKYRKIA